MREKSETKQVCQFTVLVICVLNIVMPGRAAQAQGTDIAAAQAVGTAFLRAKEAGDWKAARWFPRTRATETRAPAGSGHCSTGA